MRNLRDKRALLTGAAGGIGRCFALALARQGTQLSLWDVDAEKLTQVADEVRGHGVTVETVQCDLAQPAQISQCARSLLSRWNHVDLLINNAGVAYYGPTKAMTAEQWHWLLQVNLHAPIQLTCELLPAMLELSEAHVLNVCSIAGLVARARLAAYHASKFGLVGFTESMRAELAGHNVGFTALCPGFVSTGMYERALNGKPRRRLKSPPRWLCDSPERVARIGIKAIRRNRGLVVVSPMAKILWLLKRLSPGFMDFVNCFRRKKPKSADENAAPTDARDRKVA